MQFFKFHEVEHEILALPTNEAHKDFDLVFQVADALERFGINRCFSQCLLCAVVPCASISLVHLCSAHLFLHLRACFGLLSRLNRKAIGSVKC